MLIFPSVPKNNITYSPTVNTNFVLSALGKTPFLDVLSCCLSFLLTYGTNGPLAPFTSRSSSLLPRKQQPLAPLAPPSTLCTASRRHSKPLKSFRPTLGTTERKPVNPQDVRTRAGHPHARPCDEQQPLVPSSSSLHLVHCIAMILRPTRLTNVQAHQSHSTLANLSRRLSTHGNHEHRATPSSSHLSQPSSSSLLTNAPQQPH